MSGDRQRKVWPWVALGVATVVVLIFLGLLIWRMLNPPIVPYVETETNNEVIQINVVNAARRDGAGRHTMEYFRKRGFDVVELSNAPYEADTSYVIDRVGDRTSALKVARVIGIADSVVISDIDSMLFVRATVVLGKDLDKLKPFEP